MIDQNNLCNKTRQRAGFALLFALVLAFAIVTPATQAATYKVIHTFSGADGSWPKASLIMDPAGNFYGTTSAGGTFGWGTVFKLDPAFNETVLYSFTGGADGGGPVANVIRDPLGNLYGTTNWGGGRACSCGTVFKLDPSGNLTVLYTFTGSFDGGSPLAGLIRDGDGNLYGTTSTGPGYGEGNVFKVDAAGQETVLHSFGQLGDGSGPRGLIADKAGNLYGATGGGGQYNFGTVFKLDIKTGTETVLYSFRGATDGAIPWGGLTLDNIGNLYGTTNVGGAYGRGTVFKLDTAGNETVLHSFTGPGADGQYPYGFLLRDSAGNLYGTASSGADNYCKVGQLGCGTVFKLDAAGHFIVLHRFRGTDGSHPWAGLTRDSAGNLYGTAELDETAGGGVVFMISFP